jgi:hypothetical protein
MYQSGTIVTHQPCIKHDLRELYMSPNFYLQKYDSGFTDLNLLKRLSNVDTQIFFKIETTFCASYS